MRWLDSAGVWQDVFEEDLQYDVRGLTIIANTLRVYTQKTLTVVDIGSLTVIDTIEYPFEIRGVHNAGNLDYVKGLNNERPVASNYYITLYVCSGLEFQPIYRPHDCDSLLQWQTDVFDYNLDTNFDVQSNLLPSLATYGDNLFIASEEGSAFVYGSTVPGIPKSLSRLPAIDSEGDLIDEVYSVHVYEGVLYLGYKANSKFKIGKYEAYREGSTADKATDGMWISRRMDMGDRSRRKHLQEIRIGKHPDSTSSQLYIRKDQGSWELLDTLNETGRAHRVINP